MVEITGSLEIDEGGQISVGAESPDAGEQSKVLMAIPGDGSEP